MLYHWKNSTAFPNNEYYPRRIRFDPIWFGIIVVRMCEIGLITPPVGLNVFIIQGVARDVPMYTVFRGIIPFVLTDLVHVALLVAVPTIATILPTYMY